jgi:hypothetical protein
MSSHIANSIQVSLPSSGAAAVNAFCFEQEEGYDPHLRSASRFARAIDGGPDIGKEKRHLSWQSGVWAAG